MRKNYSSQNGVEGQQFQEESYCSMGRTVPSMNTVVRVAGSALSSVSREDQLHKAVHITWSNTDKVKEISRALWTRRRQCPWKLTWRGNCAHYILIFPIHLDHISTRRYGFVTQRTDLVACAELNVSLPKDTLNGWCFSSYPAEQALTNTAAHSLFLLIGNPLKQRHQFLVHTQGKQKKISALNSVKTTLSGEKRYNLNAMSTVLQT